MCDLINFEFWCPACGGWQRIVNYDTAGIFNQERRCRRCGVYWRVLATKGVYNVISPHRSITYKNKRGELITLAKAPTEDSSALVMALENERGYVDIVIDMPVSNIHNIKDLHEELYRKHAEQFPVKRALCETTYSGA